MNELKQLLGEAITDDTANKIEELIQSRIDEMVTAKDESNIQDLKEKEELIESLYQEINDLKEEHDVTVSDLKEKAQEYGDYLKEQAEKYAEQVREETTQEISEQADAYGDFLQEQAEKYGSFLIEKADNYGDYLQEKAEGYGTTLIEKADEYAEQRVNEAKEESAKLVEQFKEEHKEQFERLDEHQRMTNVFNSLKTLVESSGFSLDESKHNEVLEKELHEARKEKRQAERLLRESNQKVKEYNIVQLIESTKTDLAFTEKERIIKTAMRTRCNSEDDLKEVVQTLVENTSTKSQENNNQLLTESHTLNKEINDNNVADQGVVTGSQWEQYLV